MINRMDKKFLVSFLLAVSFLFLIATVSAAGQSATITKVEINGVNVNDNPVVTVGDTVTVRVDFSSVVNASDMKVRVDLQGTKQDVEAETQVFDVETGLTYSKTLQITVPFDLNDVLSDFSDLNVQVTGNGLKTEADYNVRVQREPYNADIMSVTVPQTVNAGQLFPVDIVLKNLGYDNLNDLYVTASIPALGIQSKSYFGDLVALECNKDANSVDNYGVNITRKCNENNLQTTTGRMFLQLPWTIQAGTYALEVDVKNADTTSSQTTQVVVNNAFSSGNFVVSGNQLLIVNPTNQVAVYRLVPESSSTVSVTLSDTAVAVPAGSSRTVNVEGTSSAGTQNYAVDIFASDGSLLGKANFTTSSGAGAASPIVVLTIILAIIFIVLLVVLIVLIGKKPNKSEEFGESYY